MSSPPSACPNNAVLCPWRTKSYISAGPCARDPLAAEQAEGPSRDLQYQREPAAFLILIRDMHWWLLFLGRRFYSSVEAFFSLQVAGTDYVVDSLVIQFKLVRCSSLDPIACAVQSLTSD